MIVLRGKYNSANVFTDSLEKSAGEQITQLCNQPAFEGCKIVIMPDVHAGMGCVIGFTSDHKDKIIPNLIGVDIGCGVKVVELGNLSIKFDKLDKFIRNQIPFGKKIRSKALEIDGLMADQINEVSNIIDKTKNLSYYYQSLGTLGGGNHFIEIDKDEEGFFYLLIHSGSRHFGHNIAEFFQNKALKYCKEKSKAFVGKSQEENIYDVHTNLAFLEGKDAQEYLQHMKIACKYALLNRDLMAKLLCDDFFEILNPGSFTTIHNYIDDAGIIRKGAVSAHLDEKLVIPLNMKDGAIIAKGKGNVDWNYSSPHGAGRIMSRNEAFKKLSLEEYKASMNGIYTTSVCRSTLDEAPMAYKSFNDTSSFLNGTIDILSRIKPVYNFKSQD